MTVRTSPNVSWPTEKVFAAAVLAHRTNDGYYKSETVEYQNIDDNTITIKKSRNLDLMRQYLTSEEDPCTNDDYLYAKIIIDYYQSKLLDLMSGKLNTYSRAACYAVNKETITDLIDVGLIASLPKAHESSVIFDSMLERKETAFSQSRYIGSPGENYQGKVTVISSVYSQKWFRHFHTVQDIATGNVLNFSSNSSLILDKEITIKGKVKDHVNGNATRLNYVKISVDTKN
jgi:hypothetical protein